MRWSLLKPLTLGDAAHMDLTKRGIKPSPPAAAQSAGATTRVKRRWVKQGGNTPGAVDWWFRSDDRQAEAG